MHKFNVQYEKCESFRENYSQMLRQCLVAFTGFLQGMTSGSAFGFTSTLFAQLAETNEITLSVSQSSWIASIIMLSMMATVPPAGWILNIFGRRKGLCTAFLITILSWTMTYCANSYEMLLITRIISGISVCFSFIGAVILIGEVTSPSNRTVFLTTVPLGNTSGVLLFQLLGMYMHWRNISLILVAIGVYNAIAVLCFAESHIWLIHKNRIGEARESFAWYRSVNPNSLAEFDAAAENVTKQKSLKETLKLCLSANFLVPFALTTFLFTAEQLAGDCVIVIYTSQIIRIVTNDPNAAFYANLALNILRVIAVVVSALLVKKFSARGVCIGSTCGLAFASGNIALFLYLSKVNPENAIYPIIGLLGIGLNVFFFGLGLGPLPTVFSGELYPACVRDLGTAMSIAFAFFAMFSIVKLTPHLLELFAPYYLFIGFFSCMVVSVIIMWFTLPNTKNKTLKQLESYYKE